MYEETLFTTPHFQDPDKTLHPHLSKMRYSAFILDKIKLHSKETYEEIIWNLIEDTKELSEETLRNIAEARKEYEKGNFITLENLKKKYKT